MNRYILIAIFILIFSSNSFSNYKLENNFGYLQDITFELYDASIESYKMPEHLQSIEETLMYEVLHAVWRNNKWVAYTLNNNILGTYKVGSPTIIENKEGKKIFFIANFPGTKGGTDLYMSEFADGIWMKPKNMGSKINTSYNESNPGMLDENNLTFSSNGIIKKLNINSFAIEDAPLENKKIVENKKIETPVFVDKKEVISTTNQEKYKPNTEYKPNTTTIINNNNEQHISLGKVSTLEAKSKFPLAIQVGSYMNPNWNILNQFSNLGQLTTFKNERDLNVVWLTGFSNVEQMNQVLQKVKLYSSFEKSFVVK
jgi:hypothetical protein